MQGPGQPMPSEGTLYAWMDMHAAIGACVHGRRHAPAAAGLHLLARSDLCCALSCRSARTSSTTHAMRPSCMRHTAEAAQACVCACTGTAGVCVWVGVGADDRPVTQPLCTHIHAGMAQVVAGILHTLIWQSEEGHALPL
jgi:hypothetical protein